MKKLVAYIFLIIAITLIYSCSDNDDNSANDVTPDDNSDYDTYVISMNGGGGLYTESVLKFTMSSDPESVFGKGYSDDTDGNVRVGISNSPENFESFAGDSYTEILGVNSTFYVLLNSKWGTDIDTYAWLKIELPKGGSISYSEYDDHDDDLGYVNIEKQ
jgi:hypothetical protein